MAIRGYKTTPNFSVAMKLLIPTESKVKGTTVKAFPDPSNVPVFFGSFRTYGGTENLSNNIYTVFDTAIIDTWYNPSITNDCRILICETGAVYDIISVPENIEMRYKFMQFKVQKVGGKA